MLLAAAAALLAAGAGAAALSLRLNLVGTLLAAYVIAAATVVALAEVLSPFGGVGRAGMLTGELLFGAAATAAWHVRGRHVPRLPRVEPGALRRHPLLVALGLAVAAGLVLELALVLDVAPNNWDGLTYHLSRAAGWYQRGSIAPFPAHTTRQWALAANAEIQILWTFVFAGGDRFANVPQYLAELATLIAIFGCSRRLGFARSESAFAALLFATLSAVVLQATTTQNDLVVTACVVTAAYFVLGRERKELALAALAFGLALGTKLTAIFAAPILVLLALVVLPRRRVLELVGYGAVAFALVGSFVYVDNVRRGDSPAGPATLRAPFTPQMTAAGTVSTVARIGFRFVDLTGYQADYRVLDTLKKVGGFAFTTLHIPTEPPESTKGGFDLHPNVRANEDLAYYGPLGALLILPLALGYAGAALLRRAPATHGVLAAALPLITLELALAYRYNQWLGRFLMIAVALVAPLVARAYAARLLSTLYVAFAVLFLGFALAHNERKPVGFAGAKPFWTMDRVELQSLPLTSLESTMRAVDDVIPQDARVGYVFGDDDWDYPLYGRTLQRRLVELPAADTFAHAERNHLEWVVTSGRPCARAGWTCFRVIESGWFLAAPRGSAEAAKLDRYFARARTAFTA